MNLFLSQQKISKRKSSGGRVLFVERILLSIVVVFGGLSFLYGAYLLVVFGPVFQISNIVIEGDLVQVKKQEILGLVNLNINDKLFGFDATLCHEKIKEHSWVKYAVIRRSLPGTVWIYIEEHEPIAVIIKDEKPYYLNRQGDIFKLVESADYKDFPVITGSNIINEDVVKLLSLYRTTEFGKFWDVSEIHLDKDIGYSIITKKGPVEILIGKQEFFKSFNLLDKYMKTIEQINGKIKYILANDFDRITVGYHS